MRIILLVLSLLAFFAGVGFLSAAKSQIHEIEAFMLFIVAATLVSAAAVVDTVLRAIARNDRMEEMLETLSNKMDAMGEKHRAEPPAVVTSEAPAYWVRLENDSNGPFPISKLRELRKRGTIDDDTPVAREGEKEWKKTREIIGA